MLILAGLIVLGTVLSVYYAFVYCLCCIVVVVGLLADWFGLL